MKRSIKSTLILTFSLIVSSVFICFVGLIIKYPIAGNPPLLKDIPAVAVIFAIMQDETLLSDNSNSDTGFPDTSENITPEPTPDILDNPELSVTPDLSVTPGITEPPVPKDFHPVTEDYFDDALFIGDSRMVGLAHFSRLGDADYFASVGLSAFNIFSVEASDQNFDTTTLTELLSENSYGKIYLTLGVNDLGYAKRSLYPKLARIVEDLRRLQPDAHLFLLANLSLTPKISASRDYFALSNIVALNEYIATLADQINIFYLDVNSHFCDEEGYLKPEFTSDGIHLYAKHYRTWSDFLMENGV